LQEEQLSLKLKQVLHSLSHWEHTLIWERELI